MFVSLSFPAHPVHACCPDGPLSHSEVSGRRCAARTLPVQFYPTQFFVAHVAAQSFPLSPAPDLQLNFAKIKWIYTKGSSGPSSKAEAGWNLEENKKI
jgi:type VI protein secretion system component Hcp